MSLTIANVCHILTLLLHSDTRSQAKCEGLNPICLIFQAFGADAHIRTEGIQKAQVLLDGPDIEIGQVGIGGACR